MSDQGLERIGALLEQILAVLRVANSDKIDALKRSLDSDPVAAAILDKVDLELTAGELVAEVMKVVPQKERTIQTRLAELARAGILRMSKVGVKTYYVRTGLI